MLVNEINELEKNMDKQTLISLEIYAKSWGNGTWVNDAQAQKYYASNRLFQNMKKELSVLKDKRHTQRKSVKPVKTDYAMQIEERRAIKEANVTSLSYERAQSKLFNEVNGFLCGKA